MKIIDRLKKMGGEIMKTVNPTDEDKTLSKWKNRLQMALSNYDTSLMDTREQIYLGTRKVDANVNNNKRPNREANNIYNVVFEMIESQVNSTIPQPNVKAKRDGFDEQASMIEDSISNDLKEIGIEEINDINERITPIQGFSIMEVDWDPDFKHHLYRGEIKVTSKHPKQLIPQPGVYNLQKMDYFFILSSVTKDYIKRRYNVDDLDYEGEQYPDINTTTTIGDKSPTNDNVTEIVCYYKDKDGDIGKYVWINDRMLEDLPKFYYRRVDGQTQDSETLTEPITLSDGTVLQPGEKVPFFTPTCYPVVIRKNVPKNFTFGGQSDVDTIRDQQDSIKKVGTKVEEKVMKGGSLVIIPDDLKADITNETYQIIRASIQQANTIQTRDLTAPIVNDLNYIDQQRQVIQYMLGITNSFQGQEDSSATTGVAKQIQVQQASGRMRSKEFNKQTAFKELFQIMFEFKLSFYDELRPYLAKDANGNDVYGDFDKYKFLMKDASGQLFYNTDFIFSADSGAGIPKDSLFQFNQAINMFASQAINQLQFWTILEALNYPMAKEIKSQIEEQQQQTQEAMAQQGQPMAPDGQPVPQDMSGQVPADAQQGATQQGQFDPLADFKDTLSKLPKQQQDAFFKKSKAEQLAIIQQHMAQGQAPQQQ